MLLIYFSSNLYALRCPQAAKIKLPSGRREIPRGVENPPARTVRCPFMIILSTDPLEITQI